MNDCITTTKQSTTKPCAYFVGYTVCKICFWKCYPQNGGHFVQTRGMLTLDFLSNIRLCLETEVRYNWKWVGFKASEAQVGYTDFDDAAWWRHQMEIFSALLALCAENSPVAGEFPTQRPVTRSFEVFFDLRLNNRLRKQSWGWWFETLSCPLWRHCNECNIYHQLLTQDIAWLPWYVIFYHWMHFILWTSNMSSKTCIVVKQQRRAILSCCGCGALSNFGPDPAECPFRCWLKLLCGPPSGSVH